MDPTLESPVSASTVLLGKCCGMIFQLGMAVSILNSEQWWLLEGTLYKRDPINFPSWRKKGFPPAPLKLNAPSQQARLESNLFRLLLGPVAPLSRSFSFPEL